MERQRFGLSSVWVSTLLGSDLSGRPLRSSYASTLPNSRHESDQSIRMVRSSVDGGRFRASCAASAIALREAFNSLPCTYYLYSQPESVSGCFTVVPEMFSPAIFGGHLVTKLLPLVSMVIRAAVIGERLCGNGLFKICSLSAR